MTEKEKQPQKDRINSDECLIKLFSELEDSVNKGILLKKKVQLKNASGPPLADIIREGKYTVCRSEYKGCTSLVLPSSHLLMYNPTFSVYLYYSDYPDEHYPMGKNPCYSRLLEGHAFTAEPYCPIIYASTEENLEKAEKELRKHDWVFF